MKPGKNPGNLNLRNDNSVKHGKTQKNRMKPGKTRLILVKHSKNPVNFNLRNDNSVKPGKT